MAQTPPKNGSWGCILLNSGNGPVRDPRNGSYWEWSMTRIYRGFKWMPAGPGKISSSYFAMGAENKNLAGRSGIGVLVVRFGQVGGLSRALKKSAHFYFVTLYETEFPCHPKFFSALIVNLWMRLSVVKWTIRFPTTRATFAWFCSK